MEDLYYYAGFQRNMLGAKIILCRKSEREHDILIVLDKLAIFHTIRFSLEISR